MMRTLKSDALLMLTATIWGFAFVAQRVGMEYVGPFTFNGVRFALGSLSLVPLMLLKRKNPSAIAALLPPADRRTVAWGGALAGLVLFMGASLQQVGLVHTTAGNAGFITGLYVVIVPLLGLFWRQRPDLGTWIGALLAAAGLYLLSVTAAFEIAFGDLLVLVGAFFWAAHVLIIGWLSPRIESIQLACIQFAVCSLLSLITAAALETMTLQGLMGAALPILYGGLLSVGVAYTLQVVAQRDARPAHAAIILSLESVFAALGGWLLLGELLSARALAGCSLMMAGMLLSQLHAFVFRRKRAGA
ncbi:MAG: DMT family transporter [Desulfobacterales bacterium]|nr:DMT family transporter [Desulfobacterales bacterium]